MLHEPRYVLDEVHVERLVLEHRAAQLGDQPALHRLPALPVRVVAALSVPRQHCKRTRDAPPALHNGVELARVRRQLSDRSNDALAGVGRQLCGAVVTVLCAQ